MGGGVDTHTDQATQGRGPRGPESNRDKHISHPSLASLSNQAQQLLYSHTSRSSSSYCTMLTHLKKHRILTKRMADNRGLEAHRSVPCVH